MDFSELKGAASPANCARKMPGPFMVVAIACPPAKSRLTVAARVTEIVEIRRQRGPARIEGCHADKGAGKGTVLTSATFIRDHARVKNWSYQFPLFCPNGELQFGPMHLSRQSDRTFSGKR